MYWYLPSGLYNNFYYIILSLSLSFHICGDFLEKRKNFIIKEYIDIFQ